MLHIIMPCGISFPDINLATFNRSAGRVFQCTENEQRFSVRIRRYILAMTHGFGFMCVKGAKDGSLCGMWWFGMVYGINKKR
jgi:hypothetical protein